MAQNTPYSTPASVLSALKELANSTIASHSKRFFKTDEGQYGAGDQFLGIRVPILRSVAKQSVSLDNAGVCTLLRSPWHEARLTALLIWVYQFPKVNSTERSEIVKHYLNNSKHINNWDLVDSSAYKILGPYFFDRSREKLYELTTSSNLWERRIAVITTFHFIRHDDFKDTLAICEDLLNDDQDLIHKATGWMLREVGKRNASTLRSFLDQYAAHMPRTMLRYSLEKLATEERRYYMTLQK